MDVSNWTRWEIEHPQHFESYSFENIDIQWWYNFSENYWALPFYVTILYYVCLYVCYRYMKSRPAMDLRRELFIWNLVIGAFSIFALVRMTPEFLRVLFQSGFHKSVCVRYHHTIACLVPMQLIHLGEPIGRWFTWLNYLCHAIIYPYFALKAKQLKIPKAASSIVVIMEMIQMVVGLGVALYSMYIISNGGDCIRHSTSVKLINAVYSSFVILAGKMCYEYFSKNKVSHSKLKEA